jgi:hypothetical protein
MGCTPAEGLDEGQTISQYIKPACYEKCLQGLGLKQILRNDICNGKQMEWMPDASGSG